MFIDFWIPPQNQLQVYKSVPRLGLEAQQLTSEHRKETLSCYNLWLTPSPPAPGSKKCPQARSGGLGIDFGAYFCKEVLSGIA